MKKLFKKIWNWFFGKQIIVEENVIEVESKEEIWKVITDFPDYEVSSFGRIRTIPLIKKEFYDNKDEFGCIELHGKKLQIHSLVAATFLGKRPKSHNIKHLDGNSKNNNAANLIYYKGRNNVDYSKGGNEFKPKLTESDVKIIRKRLQEGEDYRSIALDFPVKAYQVYKIQKGKAWKEVA